MKASSCSRRTLEIFVASLLSASMQAQAQGAIPSREKAIRQAEQLRARQQPGPAEALLTQALSAHPTDDRLLTELARVKLDSNDRTSAQAILARALDSSPNSIEANDLLGTLLLEDRHFPEAMDRFETVLAISADDRRAHAGELDAAQKLALQARSSGNSEAALLCLEHASQKLPGDATLLIDIGLVASGLHLYPRAGRALTSALALEPKNPRALYAAGRVATEAQHLPAAETYLRAYLDIRPGDATAHYGLGRVFAMQLRDPEAQAEFEHSISLKPVQSESYYELGLLAMNAQDEDRARKLFAEVLARDPKHGGALTALGQIAYRAKDYSAARTSLLAAVQSSPDYQPAHYYLGLALARLGEKKASQQELTRAADLAAQQQSKAAPVPSDATP